MWIIIKSQQKKWIIRNVVQNNFFLFVVVQNILEFYKFLFKIFYRILKRLEQMITRMLKEAILEAFEDIKDLGLWFM
jgi:hypothetical protein